MSVSQIISIASIVFALLIIPIMGAIFKMKRDNLFFLSFAVVMFFSSKIIISSRILIFNNTNMMVNMNQDILLALVVTGVFVVSSFIRFVYHFIAVKLKWRKSAFYIAMTGMIASAIYGIIANYLGYKAGMYALVVASFAYGLVESLTGLMNVIFSERKKLAWHAVPLMASTPLIASLMVRPFTSFLFESNAVGKSAIITLYSVSLAVALICLLIIYKYKDETYVTYKYAIDNPATLKRMTFQMWCAFLQALTLSAVTGLGLNAFIHMQDIGVSETVNSLIAFLSSIIWIITSGIIIRFLLWRIKIKDLLYSAIGSIITSIIIFIICLYENYLTSWIILLTSMIMTFGISIVYTLMFTKAVESQLFSNVNVTKWFLSIKAIGAGLGAIFLVVLKNNNITVPEYKQDFEITFWILLSLWTLTAIWIALRHDIVYPEHKTLRHWEIKGKTFKKL